MSNWAVGVTTVPERRCTYLVRTLSHIEAAGFPKPWLFVDGAQEDPDWAYLAAERCSGITYRYPRLFTYASWMLGLWELSARFPDADRYAMFQDDVMLCRNVRQYLDQCQYPERGYWNLISFLDNEQLLRGRSVGWLESNQFGRGAVALVFDRAAVERLLASRVTVHKPAAKKRRTINLDGSIVTALGMESREGANDGYKEMVHSPSLATHIGDRTSMEYSGYPHEFAPPLTFPGEHFDCLKWCEQIGQHI